MDTRPRVLAGRQRGTFSVHEVMRLGVDHAELRRAVRDSELVCVRRGAYVVGSRWREASADERYRLKATAVARTRPEDGLSHHAALAVHGLPLWDHDLGRVDLVSGVRQAVNRGGIWLHPAAGVELTDVGGVQAVPVARAVVRTALTMGTAAAVVAGDAALHSGLVTPNELLAEVALLSAHEGRQRALDALHRMDTAAESVAEVVWLEKRREDRIRRLGHPVERLVWEELAAPGLVGERIRAKRPNTPGYRQRTGFGSG